MTNKPSKKPAKWIRVIIMIAIISIGSKIISFAFSHISANKVHDDAVMTLTKEAKTMQETLPLELDEWTVLERVDVKDLKITYGYKVNMDAETMSSSELEEVDHRLKTANINKSCNEPELQDSLDFGVTYNHEYYDINSQPISYFKIDRQVCDNTM